jgi:hypothetical protein
VIKVDIHPLPLHTPRFAVVAAVEVCFQVKQSLMALQKVHPTALWRFFRTSTYHMYAFAPEKTPSLVG